ncbi:hypothetical protein [Methanooceanicella nereidis]|nr:hypothetical protein [Methanocella sp. CWC-04]
MEKEKKEDNDEKEKLRKRKKRMGAGNIMPAEEPVTGPSGEKTFK